MRQPIRLLNEIYNYGKDNLALIHVMIQSPYVTMIERDVSMTFTEYVANTGRDLFLSTFLVNQFFKFKNALSKSPHLPSMQCLYIL